MTALKVIGILLSFPFVFLWVVSIGVLYSLAVVAPLYWLYRLVKRWKR